MEHCSLRQEYYSGFKSKMTSRRRGSRRRRRTDSTLRSRRRANDDAALIWNWNYLFTRSLVFFAVSPTAISIATVASQFIPAYNSQLRRTLECYDEFFLQHFIQIFAAYHTQRAVDKYDRNFHDHSPPCQSDWESTLRATFSSDSTVARKRKAIISGL